MRKNLSLTRKVAAKRCPERPPKPHRGRADSTSQPGPVTEARMRLRGHDTHAVVIAFHAGGLPTRFSPPICPYCGPPRTRFANRNRAIARESPAPCARRVTAQEFAAKSKRKPASAGRTRKTASTACAPDTPSLRPSTRLLGRFADGIRRSRVPRKTMMVQPKRDCHVSWKVFSCMRRRGGRCDHGMRG